MCLQPVDTPVAPSERRISGSDPILWIEVVGSKFLPPNSRRTDMKVSYPPSSSSLVSPRDQSEIAGNIPKVGGGFNAIFFTATFRRNKPWWVAI